MSRYANICCVCDGVIPESLDTCGTHVTAAVYMRRIDDGEYVAPKCVTPNGRTDCHGRFVQFVDGKGICCSFCEESLEVTER